jgi:lysophospholipase L1-like esterase
MSLASFFVLGEVGVRLFSSPRPSMLIASQNPWLVYELDSAYPGINSLGMRDDEFDLATLHKRYRIAVIGDSHTYSIAVQHLDETFPAQLERTLEQRLGQGSVKVLNFGVPGYNTAQELEVLRSKVLRFAPHVIILQYCINDTHVCNYLQPARPRLHALLYTSRFLVTAWQALLYAPLGRKYLFDWVGTHIPDALLFQEGLVGTRKAAADEEPARRRHPPRTPARVPARYHYMLGADNWRRHVRLFAQTAHQHGIPLLATGFVEAAEQQVFEQEGFAVYAFTDMFQGQDIRQYGYNPDDTATHMNAQGCQRIGQALAAYIVTHYMQ